MYEMYPEVWTFAAAAAERTPAPGRPRRRPRREHSVVPAVIAQRLERTA